MGPATKRKWLAMTEGPIDPHKKAGDNHDVDGLVNADGADPLASTTLWGGLNGAGAGHGG